MAELEAANASSKEVADELARLDEERTREGLQVEVRIILTQGFPFCRREKERDLTHGATNTNPKPLSL